jgi:hypothetical protein
MTRTILRHLRGNVVAYVALFVALSAGAYAAKKAPKNSVVTKSIVNKAIKTKKLANGAVTEPKVTKFKTTDVTAFTNGWSSLTAATVPNYGKDVDGFVHLDGVIKGTTLHTSAFTLPTGFRPVRNTQFGSGNIGGGNSLACVVSIGADGTVTPGVLPADTGCVAAGGTLLNGIVFKAAG